MWQEEIDKGKKQLNAGQLASAEASFAKALEQARLKFSHTDKRIPETFAYLGQVLLLQKKVNDATAMLRQAAKIARSLGFTSKAVATADYLWAYIDYKDENAAERRKSKLKDLEKHLNKEELAALTAKLKELFATKTKVQEKPVLVQAAKDKPKTQEAKKPEPKKTEAPKPEKPAQKEDPKQKEQQERLTVWAEKLKRAIERSKRTDLAQKLSAYEDLYALMSETTALYEPPHVAVGDHLMALADPLRSIGLLERAAELTWLAFRNYKESLDSEHIKTAKTCLELAYIHRELGHYQKAQKHFFAAFSALQFRQDTDKKWLDEVASQFKQLQEREKFEQKIEELLHEIYSLERDRELEKANQLASETAERFKEYFPENHFHFVTLYKRHASVLYALGRPVAADALFCQASYIEALVEAREKHIAAMDKKLPPFPQMVLQALYCEKIMEEELKKRS